MNIKSNIYINKTLQSLLCIFTLLFVTVTQNAYGVVRSYMRLDASMAKTRSNTWDYSYTGTSTELYGDTFPSKNGWGASIGMGYKINKYLRIDGNIGGNTNVKNSDSTSTTTSGTTGSTTLTPTFKNKGVKTYVDVYLDMPFFNSITPYVGVGAGIGVNKGVYSVYVLAADTTYSNSETSVLTFMNISAGAKYALSTYHFIDFQYRVVKNRNADVIYYDDAPTIYLSDTTTNYSTLGKNSRQMSIGYIYMF